MRLACHVEVRSEPRVRQPARERREIAQHDHILIHLRSLSAEGLELFAPFVRHQFDLRRQPAKRLPFATPRTKWVDRDKLPVRYQAADRAGPWRILIYFLYYEQACVAPVPAVPRRDRRDSIIRRRREIIAVALVQRR